PRPCVPRTRPPYPRPPPWPGLPVCGSTPPGRAVRVVRRLARQIDAEGGSAVGSRRLEDQVAAHRQAQLTRDVQSEPAAIIGGPIRSALEPPEEPASVGLRDPRTMVGDRQPEAVRAGRRLGRDLDVDRRTLA